MVSEERRLHPLSWLFATAQAVKGLIVPLVVLLLASGGSNLELLAAVFVIPATASAVLQYVVFRYQLAEDELIVRDGVLTRRERHIPYARIQNIDLVRNPLHRMLNVALVRIETASGDRPEAVIRVLSLDAIDDMRSCVFKDRRDAASQAPGTTQNPRADIVLQLRSQELMRLGIVSNKGLVVVSAALGLLWQQGQWWDPEDLVEQYLESEWVAETLSNTPVVTGVVALAVVVLGAVLVLRVLSIAWFLVQLHGFTLRRRDGNIRAEYGLFTKISRSIPASRVQSLTAIESPLHRWFGRQSIELRTVGGGGDDPSAGPENAAPKAKSQWLAPMVATARVPQLLKEVLPEVEIEAVAWTPLARRSWLRILRRWLVVVGGGAMLGAVLFGSWTATLAWSASGSLLALAHARLYVKHAAYSLTPWGIAFKSGWWDRTTKIVRYSKIQTIARGETPFDRRSGMASVRIDTAGAERIGHTIDIPFLDADVATAVAQRISNESSQHAFRW